MLSCSYHVALTATLAGCETWLCVANAYYLQKLSGIQDCVPTANLHALQPDWSQVDFTRTVGPLEAMNGAVAGRHAVQECLGPVFRALEQESEDQKRRLSKAERALAEERHAILNYARQLNLQLTLESYSQKFEQLGQETRLALDKFSETKPAEDQLNAVLQKLSEIRLPHDQLDSILSKLSDVRIAEDQFDAIMSQFADIKLPHYVQKQIALEVLFEKQRWGLPYKIARWFRGRQKA